MYYSGELMNYIFPIIPKPPITIWYCFGKHNRVWNVFCWNIFNFAKKFLWFFKEIESHKQLNVIQRKIKGNMKIMEVMKVMYNFIMPWIKLISKLIHPYTQSEPNFKITNNSSLQLGFYGSHFEIFYLLKISCIYI